MDGVDLANSYFFYRDIFVAMYDGRWEYFSPGGEPRHGILGLDTTRGDRLFISLLGSGFIHIAWLGLLDILIWGAFVLSIVYAIAVFKWV